MLAAALLLLVDPNGFAANHQTGEAYVRQRQFIRALPYLEKAYRLDASNEANAFDLCLVYLELKQPEKARPIVDALLRQADKAELHHLLGDVEEAAGHVDDAARQYEIAARMDPSETNLFDLGNDLLNHQGFEPALKVFVYATGRYPLSVRLRVGLGIAYFSLSRFDEAVAALCAAVDLNPKDASAYDFLGKMYDVSETYATAVGERLRRFVDQYPNSAPANLYYALFLRKRFSGGVQQTGQAEGYLRKALQLDAGLTQAHFELGLICEERAANVCALEQYAIAARQQPHLAKAHYRLARLYAKEGKPAQAKREFDIVESLKPSAHSPNL